MIVMLDKNNYQNNIKQFRVREGLTQEELAKKINTSRTYRKAFLVLKGFYYLFFITAHFVPYKS